MFCDVLPGEVVLENALTVALALFLFLDNGRSDGRPRQGVQRHRLVLRVSNLFEFVVGNSSVGDVRGVVRRHKAGQFREIGSHLLSSWDQFIN